MFGHWFEILVLLGLALLVFGPKRMIEMGSQVGKAFRELQSSVKDMNLSSLLNTDDEPAKPTTVETLTSKISQFSQNVGERSPLPASVANASQTDSAPVVEGSIEHVEERAE
ncbi:MAG TPA: twin-arginine translocase TatA/TatE family subunit [Ktedonobacterales bacterium]|nr:twin-arginine translocase TatA/TatE family subunit [Ktedonobacterales bacterium]